jgi:hypothetical protein
MIIHSIYEPNRAYSLTRLRTKSTPFSAFRPGRISLDLAASLFSNEEDFRYDEALGVNMWVN